MNPQATPENQSSADLETIQFNLTQAQAVTGVRSKIDKGFTKGVPIAKPTEQEGPKVNSEINKFFSLMYSQHPSLSNIKVDYITPEDESETGGYFELVEVGGDVPVPTVFVMPEQTDHMRDLMRNRQSSAKMVAHMLGIPFEKMTPRLLGLFIMAHELGHATDYIRNYELNSDYKGIKAVEEWDMHYAVNLLSLPVSGLDPAELRQEMKNFGNLDEFLNKFPDTKKEIDLEKVKTLDDLLHEQEIAYRSMPYENYADNFAVNFLKRNAQELEILELLDERRKMAA